MQPNFERLEQAARVMDEVAAKNLKFSLDAWLTHSYKKDGDYVEPDCGTVACAFGYCALDKWHQDQGLKVDPIPIFYPEPENTLVSEPEPASYAIMYLEHDGVDYGFGYIAIYSYFSLNDDEAVFLFSEAAYAGTATATDVAERIRNFIEQEKGIQL